MTEDEKMRDPDYLRGRLDAAVEMIGVLICILPHRALTAVEHEMRLAMNDRQKRAGDALQTTGFLDTASSFVDLVSKMYREREIGESFPLVAASKEADDADDDDRVLEEIRNE